MRTGRQIFASLGAIAAMLAMAAWAWPRLSAGRIAIHWGADGRANGYASTALGLFVLPTLSTLLTAFFALAPVVAPSRSRIERSGAAWTASWLSTLGALVFGQALIVLKNLRADIDVTRASAVFVALVLVITGNWMGKIRYNYMFGFRTPWTLADERVWDRTHRFAGRLMVVFGLALLGLGLAAPHARDGRPLFWTLVACATAPALLGLLYSILISKPGSRAADGGPR